MEASKHVDRQHDSFGEIDRILIVVEESKKEYENIKSEKSSRMIVALYIPMILSFISFSISIYDLVANEPNVSNSLFFIVPVLIFLIVEIRYTLIYNKNIRQKRKEYEATNSQATELLREIAPIVAQRENWSTLQRLEFKLRMSKLDISSEEILEYRSL